MRPKSGPNIRFSAGICPSDFGFDGVFPMVRIISYYLQPIGLYLLALWFDGLLRALKQPWPPPGFLLLRERFGNLSSCWRWCGMIVLHCMVILVCDWFLPMGVQLFREEVRMINYGWFIILSKPLYKGLLQESEDFKTIKRRKMLFLYDYKLKIWCYWFQRKKISMPWIVTTKHVNYLLQRHVWDGRTAM